MKRFVACMIMAIGFIFVALGQVPQTISYQGVVTDASGDPIPDGSHSFVFKIYEVATGGSAVWVESQALQTSSGLFNAILGEIIPLNLAFDRPYFLGISVDGGSEMTPRIELTSSPYSLMAKSVPNGSITQNKIAPGQVVKSLNGLRDNVTLAEGSNIDITTSGNTLVISATGGGLSLPFSGSTSSSPAFEVTSSSTASESKAIAGIFSESNGQGVYGYASATSGFADGVWGVTNSIVGWGVHGLATDTSGFNIGVRGASLSSNGTGVRGFAAATSGNTEGVFGESRSSSGIGVYGLASAAGGNPKGVYGKVDNTQGQGVYGEATSTSGFSDGVWGVTNSTVGWGVYGVANANSGSNVGVRGKSNSPNGYGGYFVGDLHTTADFSATGSKAFKIDHPLDPANRYLYHFAQEAPEVQNVYNGVVTLNAAGEATVILPEYFSVLNTGTFRYQLTPIGAPMPDLYVAEEIQGNRFTIAGGVSGEKVSWEITAARNDPYVRDHPAQAEVDKPAEERGTYLYPEGYGLSEEMGLEYQHDREREEAMKREQKLDRETKFERNR